MNSSNNTSRLAKNAFCLACTLFMLALLTMWPIAHARPIFIAVYGPAGKPAVAGVGWGECYLVRSNVPYGTERAWTIGCTWLDSDGAATNRAGLQQLDVKYGTTWMYCGRFNFRNEPASHFDVAAAPIWIICIPLLFVSQRWTRRALRTRYRTRRGLCLNCGYDLRGTPGRCPECGISPAK